MAGNVEAMEIEFSIELLSICGKVMPHRQVFYFGGGGNSKGSKTRIRDKCYGDAHQYISPDIIDCGKDDEFRKQGPGFHSAKLTTMQEGGRFRVDEARWNNSRRGRI